MLAFEMRAGAAKAIDDLTGVAARGWPGSGAFGLLKTAKDCPRLHEAVRAVGQRVDTAPVDEIYLSPGSAIGVRQDGGRRYGYHKAYRLLAAGFSRSREFLAERMAFSLYGKEAFGFVAHLGDFQSTAAAT